MERYKKQVEQHGFAVIDAVYTDDEVKALLDVIGAAETSGETFRKSAGLFAIRQFLKEVPNAIPLLLTSKLKNCITGLFGTDNFIVKSIYFDKPEQSNWFVAYHQDLTISVDKRVAIEGYGPWTVRHNQFGVQPPIEVLQNIFTIRIHLDDTDENNGALKVIPGSHKNIYRPETIDWAIEKEVSCNVSKGGIMIMKPLLLHSSARTTNNNKRRVIHIEFSSTELPEQLQWAEKLNIE
jgi:ectoine hydroxylase-related dioxygenase (phytanoyl-CoA dioxygenase family)